MNATDSNHCDEIIALYIIQVLQHRTLWNPLVYRALLWTPSSLSIGTATRFQAVALYLRLDHHHPRISP